MLDDAELGEELVSLEGSLVCDLRRGMKRRRKYAPEAE